MIEWAASGLLGSLLGGLFRLAPEVLKFFDRKNERQHEYKMFELQTDLEKVKGNFRMEERYVDYSIANMQAINTAMEAEGKILDGASKWVRNAVAAVRPVITYVMFAMYLTVKITFITAGLMSGDPWTVALAANWTSDDFAMLTMILTFHFVGRSIHEYQRKY